MSTATTERSLSLDALRGIALFGVLLVNLVTIFRVSLFAMFVPDALPPGTALDHAVHSFVEVALEFKAFSLFSFLFGVGLAAQQERAGAAFVPRMVRRLGLLLVIGLVHLFLVWNGDILTLYAVLGIIAVPLLAWRTPVLVAVAILCFVVQVLPVPFPRPFDSTYALATHVELANRIYPNGSFVQVLGFRIHEVGPIATLLVWVAPKTLGTFLLGAAAWREGALAAGGARNLRWTFAALGLTVLLVNALVTSPLPGPVTTLGPTVQALGYAALVLLAFDRPVLARGLAIFAPLGRMAITSYLTQSVLLGAIFYGWGLGLFGKLGEARAFGLGVAIYVAQLAFSAWWLARFRFGPVEWLWRSFTYGAWQPLRGAARGR